MLHGIIPQARVIPFTSPPDFMTNGFRRGFLLRTTIGELLKFISPTLLAITQSIKFKISNILCGVKIIFVWCEPFQGN